MTTTQRVHLDETYFIDRKRRDGQVSAVLLFTRQTPHPGLRRRDVVELLAADEESLDQVVTDWAESNSTNFARSP